ncbi:MAG TPA: DMT family transporter [Patescibacteria group bacterium]|nr:DMT family transporter [Patescibacteria group bacterium]
MGTILVLIAALMWSFVGILVKTAAIMVNSSVISVARFLFGVIFLGGLLLFRDGKIKLHGYSKWIWIGAIGKSLNYIFENIAISLGFSYGNILVMPLQAIFLVGVSALYFKETIKSKHWVAIGLCIIGVFLVSWNGLPLDILFQSNSITTLLFTLAAIGCGFHALSQKMLIQTMDSASMNFSVFFWSILLTSIPLSPTFQWTGIINGWSVFSLIVLGFITGISFYIYANALKHMSFVVASILSNSSALFTLLWSRLFYKEQITHYIVWGTVLFLAGVTILNIPANKFLRKNSAV